MLIYSTYTYLFTGSVSAMSDNSDSQNKSEEQENLNEGSRSTPSNLPKAATR